MNHPELIERHIHTAQAPEWRWYLKAGLAVLPWLAAAWIAMAL